MQPKHHHGLVAAVAAIAVVLIFIIVKQPFQANPESENFKTHVDKGLSPEAQAEFDLRIATQKASVEADTTPDPHKLLVLGNLYYQVGELASARETYEKLLEVSKEDVAARENLGVTLAEMGDYKTAERMWAEALERSATVVTVTRLVDLINEHIPEDKVHVKEILEKAIQSLGQDSMLLGRLGDWYLEAKDYERAISHYQVAIDVGGNKEYYEGKIEEARKLLVGQPNP